LENHEVPALYTTQYEGRAAEDYCNEWLFKAAEIPVQQIEPFIPWLIENHGEQFYLLGSDYIWPQTMNDLISDAVEKHGGEVLQEEYVQLNATDFSSIIPRIEQADPDILFMEVTGASVPAIQQQMLEQGVRDQWTEVGLAHGHGVLAGAPPEAVEGLLSCHAYTENLDNSANEEFVGKFKDEYGQDSLMTYLTGPAYTGMKLLEAAVEEAGGASTEDIMAGLQDASVDSVMGETTMAADHQVSVGTTVTEVNADQKYDPITSFDPVSPEDACETI
jgi:urea transport system substrate-binding protein